MWRCVPTALDHRVQLWQCPRLPAPERTCDSTALPNNGFMTLSHAILHEPTLSAPRLDHRDVPGSTCKCGPRRWSRHLAGRLHCGEAEVRRVCAAHSRPLPEEAVQEGAVPDRRAVCLVPSLPSPSLPSTLDVPHPARRMTRPSLMLSSCGHKLSPATMMSIQLCRHFAQVDGLAHDARPEQWQEDQGGACCLRIFSCATPQCRFCVLVVCHTTGRPP